VTDRQADGQTDTARRQRPRHAERRAGTNWLAVVLHIAPLGFHARVAQIISVIVVRQYNNGRSTYGRAKK